jgi:BMFP domain-containing protein YqiC
MKGSRIDMNDEDIQKIAQCVYDMICNDLQQMKRDIEQAIYSAQNSIVNEVSTQGHNTRSSIRNIEGQMYNLRRA